MPVVWTDRHRLHEPKGEVWLGVWIEGTEVPARGDRIRAALAEAHASFIEPNHYDDGPFEAVHDPDFLSFLATAYDDWVAGGYLEEPGQDRVVPYVFPLPQLTPGRAPRKPAAASARTGMFAMDTMTLIGPGTWEAARAVAEAALTAADLVADGASAAYAVCRPPGHHVGRDFYGGSCYLNNAALTAQRLRARAVPLVGIIDLDAHHGNGTQEIFYRRPDVIYGSVHVDPGAGWFPHFVGYDDETGEAEGVGANLNLPLPPGTGDAGWLEAVDRLTRFAADRGVGAMVVSLGVDAAARRPGEPVAGHGRRLCRGRPPHRRSRLAHRLRPGRWLPPGQPRPVGAGYAARLRGGEAGRAMSEAGALSSKLVAMWVGKDAHGGVPSQPRPDLPPPPHWRLEAIAATERPSPPRPLARRRHRCLRPRPRHVRHVVGPRRRGDRPTVERGPGPPCLLGGHHPGMVSRWESPRLCGRGHGLCRPRWWRPRKATGGGGRPALGGRATG